MTGDTYIYGYSDTPQKHDFTLMLRCNGIVYDFIDNDRADYEGAVVIRICKPQYKWQRRILDDLVREIVEPTSLMPLVTHTQIVIRRKK